MPVNGADQAGRLVLGAVQGDGAGQGGAARLDGMPDSQVRERLDQALAPRGRVCKDFPDVVLDVASQVLRVHGHSRDARAAMLMAPPGAVNKRL